MRADYNDAKENDRRLSHQHSVGNKDYFLLKKSLGVYEIDREGLYEIIDAFENSTVAIRNRAIIQTVNIRHLVPHFISNAIWGASAMLSFLNDIFNAYSCSHGYLLLLFPLVPVSIASRPMWVNV